VDLPIWIAIVMGGLFVPAMVILADRERQARRGDRDAPESPDDDKGSDA
jgi:hypothetical protein